jgi:hypothetical protein
MRKSIGLLVLLTLLAVAAPARADHRDMHVVMCRDVRDGDPVGTVAVFTGTDPQTCVHVTLVEVTRSHVVRVEVSRPNGSIYRTMQTRTREASPGRYYPKYRVWWCLSIAKREPSYTVGQWGVRVLIDGQLVATTGFQILGLGTAQVEKAQARLHALQDKVEANPADLEARLDLADALIDLDQLDEATVQLQKALDQDPDLARAHAQMGFVQYRRQRWDDAERSFLHALKLRDDSAWTHFFLARVYVEKGEKIKAIEHFRKTIQLAGDTSLGKDATDELAQLGAVP